MIKILLIHNDSANIKELNIILTTNGYNTYLAEDVANGIEIAKIYTPDLILCDIVSNGFDGVKVVKELSEHERTKVIPILYLSSEPKFENMREIMIAGADDYIPFPLEQDTLIDSIKTRLVKYHSVKKKFEKLQAESIDSNGELPIKEDHVLVKIGTNLRLIKFKDIVCVSASKEYSEIVTSESKKYVIRKSLKKWTDILPTDSFLQIHRSTIINTTFIEKLKFISEGTYEVYLHHCKNKYPVSVRNMKKLKKWIRL